jgi:hypothetical protein
MDWGHARIATWFRISSAQVLAAIRYIEEHKEEVVADYQKILERNARGNPPEIRARLEETHARVQEMMRRRREGRENRNRPIPWGKPAVHTMSGFVVQGGTIIHTAP